MKYTLTNRKHSSGKNFVAPYIGDWCVWDIPEHEYTPAVEDAIKRAYEIGLRFAHEYMQNRDVLGDLGIEK